MTADPLMAKAARLKKLVATPKPRRVRTANDDDDDDDYDYMCDTEGYQIDDQSYYKIRLPDGRELGRRPADRNGKTTSGPLVVGPADSGELFYLLSSWSEWAADDYTFMMIKNVNGSDEMDGFDLTVVDGKLNWVQWFTGNTESSYDSDSDDSPSWDYVYGQRDEDGRSYISIYKEYYQDHWGYQRNMWVGGTDRDPSYSLVDVSDEGSDLTFEVEFVRISSKSS